MQALGDRIKNNYENPYRFYLTRRTPVVIRVDGKAFHSYTRGFKKPFDQLLIDSMVSAAKSVSENMQGFKLCYVQSDEASFLLTDYDDIQTEAWFGYNKSKVETITASMFTQFFNKEIDELLKQHYKVNTGAFFDARAFNIPEKEIANYYLWRAKDWERNSINMYAMSFFSHRELQGKSCSDRHDMLHNIGENWSDLPSQLKNGTFITKDGDVICNVKANYEDISNIVVQVLNKVE